MTGIGQSDNLLVEAPYPDEEEPPVPFSRPHTLALLLLTALGAFAVIIAHYVSQWMVLS